MKLADLAVLLVEPSPIQTRIIVARLAALGIVRVQTARSGSEALAVLDGQDLHLVMSAMYLPDMNGDALARAVNALERHFRPAFVLLSSETRAPQLEPLRQAGAAAIVRKPFAAGELRATLAGVLDHLEPGQLHLADREADEVRVLLVDDSAPVRRLLRQLLTGMGIEQISEAPGGIEARALVETQFFDLVITDLHMPGLDGIGLIRHIRTDSAQRSLPVIMVTSEADAARLAEARAAGVSEICCKPFEARRLKGYIERLLG